MGHPDSYALFNIDLAGSKLFRGLLTIDRASDRISSQSSIASTASLRRSWWDKSVVLRGSCELDATTKYRMVMTSVLRLLQAALAEVTLHTDATSGQKPNMRRGRAAA